MKFGPGKLSVVYPDGRTEEIGEFVSIEYTPVEDKTYLPGKTDIEVSFTRVVRSCNLHENCDEADRATRAVYGEGAMHCHDECCEDCFGS